MSVADQLDEARGASKTSSAFNNSDASIQKRLLSKRELAAILGVSQRTIENWTAEKRIPRLRLSARLTRFSLPKVEAALNRYEIKEVGSRRWQRLNSENRAPLKARAFTVGSSTQPVGSLKRASQMSRQKRRSSR